MPHPNLWTKGCTDGNTKAITTKDTVRENPVIRNGGSAKLPHLMQAQKTPQKGRFENKHLRSEDRKHGAIQSRQLSLFKTLGLENLGADEGECVHGMSLEMAAPFPAAKSCIPHGGRTSLNSSNCYAR